MKEISVPFQEINRLLVIKLRGIGDVLLSTPLIENLKKQFPHLQIDYLCEEFACDVLRGNPWLDNVILFNKRKESGFDLIKKIRQKKYDIIIDLYGNPRTAFLTFTSGAKYRIGFPFRGRSYAYTDLVTPRGGEVHNVDFNLDVLKHFEIPITSRRPIFPLLNNEKQFAEDYFVQNGLSSKTVIGINASGGWYTKKWDLTSYASLVNKISQTEQCIVLLFWGPGEYHDAIAIQKIVKKTTLIIPKTTLKEMGALLQRCSYFISNDAGPMHIAASLDVPTLGIYGPTNPYLQGPYGEKHVWIRNEQLDCLECNLTKCPIGNVCMTELSVEVVYSAFQQLITKNKK